MSFKIIQNQRLNIRNDGVVGSSPSSGTTRELFGRERMRRLRTPHRIEQHVELTESGEQESPVDSEKIRYLSVDDNEPAPGDRPDEPARACFSQRPKAADRQREN